MPGIAIINLSSSTSVRDDYRKVLLWVQLASQVCVSTSSIQAVRLSSSVSFRARNPREPWRVLLIVLAATVVFLFALQAKTGVYGSGPGTGVTSPTSAKMWLNGQKAEVEPTAPSGTLLIWFAILFIHYLYLHRQGEVQTVFRAPAPVRRSLLHWRRCLRPPPVR
jgi:hypothetical protein